MFRTTTYTNKIPVNVWVTDSAIRAEKVHPAYTVHFDMKK